MKKLVLLGAGGHCESVLDVILQGQEFDDIAILDRPEKVGQDVMGFRLLGWMRNYRIYTAGDTIMPL